MKTHLKLIAGVALAAIASASAQDNTTKPVGFRTETLKGGVFNLLSAELTEAISAAGAASGVAGGALIDDAADFTTSLAGENKTWIVQITSGAAAGTVTTAAVTDGTTLTSADDLAAAGVAAGDSYEVRAAKTISDIFGPANEAGLKGGDAATSDLIWISDGAGGFSLYYYQDNFLGQQWVGLDGSDGTNVPIVYTDSFFVQRKDPADLDLVIVGHVQTNPANVALIQGFNFVSRIAPVGQTFATSGLETSIKGGDAGTADLIWNPDGTGGYVLYYYQDNFLGQQWVSLAGADGTNVPLSSGVIIQRKDVATNATINLPGFYADL